jgi:hypothetical protein
MDLKTLKRSLGNKKASYVQEARCHCARQKAMSKEADNEAWEKVAKELIRHLCGIEDNETLDMEKTQIAETLMQRADKIERRPVIDIAHLVTNSINASQRTIERMMRDLGNEFPMKHPHEKGQPKASTGKIASEKPPITSQETREDKRKRS